MGPMSASPTPPARGRLVVRGDLLLGLADHLAPYGGVADDAVDRFLKSSRRDDGTVLTGGQQRRLVEDIGQIRTRHTDGPLGEAVQIRIGSQRLALRMDAEDSFAAC